MILQLRRAHHLCDHAATNSSYKDATSLNAEANRSSKQTYLSYLAPTSAYRDLNDEINNYIRAQADQYLWHHRQGLNCS